MLTPVFRVGLRVGLPFALTFGGASLWLSVPENQTLVTDTVADIRASIEERPEFMVNLMAVDGADAPLSAAIREAVPLDFPLSSFDLDVEDIRATLAQMPPVQKVTVRIRPGGILQVGVTPRTPAAIWRTADGLYLVDVNGVEFAQVSGRAARPDLPVIAGEGAPDHVPEALALVQAASPLGERLRGLVRLGNRRWDVVLDRDQRILLPSENAVRALERVIALEGAQEVLSRDVARIDLRLADRPTVRMTQTATQEWWRIRALNLTNE
ncbi:cell division protein FtsQ/DivIB [uncultured Tateyamaria sp.]|uniref:cell division protein FtsQ/DivIB n=1 Tax=Tateyamaria sp. 1078 TaxID=3417464 RepID=UPI00261CB1AB|nr:cell division protein FtsQ/DivIB [uncultured Tateyamaria sp.]